MRGRGTLAIVAALAALAPVAARAQIPAADPNQPLLPQVDTPVAPLPPPPPPVTAAEGGRTVVLRSGAIYRGELVELLPGDHLTLKLATGEIKRIPWDEMVAPGAGAAMGAAQGTTEDKVSVHFHASDPRAGFYRNGVQGSLVLNNPYGMNVSMGVESWQLLCQSPCEVQAGRNQVYRVQGPGIVPSAPFSLPPGDPVGVQVRAGHTAVRTAGWWMLLIGGAAAAAGLGVLTLGLSQDTTFGGGDPMFAQMRQDALDRQHTEYIAGGTLLGAGAALAIIGPVLMATARTSVSFDGATPVGQLRLPGGGALDLPRMLVRF